ncbi:pckA [Wigglesworthia glossinidia endosymbiont of Glossina brevipalpis]|uniref:Phosphoenolpyruvate carboxykinase (ATP) n=1 Tax=Wigglesworthia glossinidia brevipalpis TaxID=36870 RepID=PCKA_WIGBR|nr:RecName: Full=Phosphoenolpyruvate carboxykinase (ATP); Short=PCK; Short=PEP carboxykinase; Short=PEPCK [Wigglesworthia glossinidia endosymbiont of Glossina brevipalpis]BAC24723.1 pckA [Wigglesworthia glossinidia endosymbiont of Glossina brevipalpis]
MKNKENILITLNQVGIEQYSNIIYNPNYDTLFKEETNKNLKGLERCILTKLQAIAVDTGKFTGRSPKDKYYVRDEKTKNIIWWSDDNNHKSNNHPINNETWKDLKKLIANNLNNKKLFVIDAFCGANKKNRLKVRFITDIAWQAHFFKNMFIEPIEQELNKFLQDFTVFSVPKAINKKWKDHKLNSENFIAINLTENTLLIGGTWYGGEIKKGLFSVMNYILPLKNIASMHCSANEGFKKDVALFFGLSGTGKTTLSTDSKRYLIGDDEHGWCKDGVFNFEGGCYAKTINLSEEKEPEIFNAIKKNAILENVMVLKDSNINFFDGTKTENSRVSYPINHIKNIVKPISQSGHPKNIIFLTADAFGVFPFVSKLSYFQGQYYFLSGFTSKLSGTERGIIDPEPTFSSCFGEAFLSLHPTVYAKILLRYIKYYNSKIFLVNTGWNGKRERYSLEYTRSIINAILDDKIEFIDENYIPIFNLKIPKKIEGVPDLFLDPRNFFSSNEEWIKQATILSKKFIKNFKKFSHTKLGKKLIKFEPKINF